MPRIKLLASAEFPYLLPQSKRPPAHRRSQFVGCVSLGIARKLNFPPRQGKSRIAHLRGVSGFVSENQAQASRRAKVMQQHVGGITPPVRLRLTSGTPSIDPRRPRAMG